MGLNKLKKIKSKMKEGKKIFDQCKEKIRMKMKKETRSKKKI